MKHSNIRVLRAFTGLATLGLLFTFLQCAAQSSSPTSAVEQRAATEEDANQRWFGGNWWRDSSNIAGITYEDLAKTEEDANQRWFGWNWWRDDSNIAGI